jgi:hypothetical protein
MATDQIAADTAERLRWIEQVYTAVAVFCFTWAATLITAIYTKGEPKLPMIGLVVQTEYVVYTLYAFSLLLPLLLSLVFWYRSALKGAGLSLQLPAPHLKGLAIEGMPKGFRAAAFVVLVGLPVFAQQLAYQRLYDQIHIVWKPDKWWRSGDYNVGDGKPFLTGSDLFTFAAKPQTDRSYANWRFSTWPAETKTRPIREEDNDGRAEFNRGREPVQISTAPGYVPWLFWITAHGSVATVAWLLMSTIGAQLTRKRVKNAATVGSETAPSHGQGNPMSSPSRMLIATDGNEILPDHIFDAIATATPFARLDTSKNYLGLRVKWRLVLVQYFRNFDGSLRLRFETERRSIHSVFCDVTADRWPFLKTIHEESILGITGTIATVNQFDIHLTDVNFKLIRGIFNKPHA